MEPGETLAERYELHEVVGRGGMGEVFRATDRTLGREVAVKVLPRHLIGDQDATRRFRREARLAASLDRSDTVTVHDVVQEGDVEAIVMEFIDGPTLADVLRDTGPLPWRRALRIAAMVADALDAAHRRDLIHRDVKPSNVLLVADNEIKVTDFGIARAGQASDTVTGTVRGSVPYLAPEQALGEPTDARTDVYGLGCLVYELLTGRPPYVADDAVGTVYQHLHAEPVPPSQRNDDVPEQVDRVVLRAIARDIDRRWPSAGAFAEALRATEAGEDVTQVLPPDPAPAHAATERVSTPPPRRGGRAKKEPVRRSQPRRSSVPLLVGLIVLVFVVLWVVGAFDDTGAATEDPAASATQTTAPPPSEPTPTPTASPSPTPSPSPEGPGTPEEEAQEVRAAIAAARSEGEISAKAEEELDKRLTEVMEKHDEGDREEALKKLDELRDKLDELVEKQEATPEARERLGPELDDLRIALGG